MRLRTSHAYKHADATVECVVSHVPSEILQSLCSGRANMELDPNAKIPNPTVLSMWKVWPFASSGRLLSNVQHVAEQSASSGLVLRTNVVPLKR